MQPAPRRERRLVILEIGARILPVSVEEELVKAAVEVVMMGDVAFRAADRIIVLERPSASCM